MTRVPQQTETDSLSSKPYTSGEIIEICRPRLSHQTRVGEPDHNGFDPIYAEDIWLKALVIEYTVEGYLVISWLEHLANDPKESTLKILHPDYKTRKTVQIKSQTERTLNHVER